jgi:hypothetical protein
MAAPVFSAKRLPPMPLPMNEPKMAVNQHHNAANIANAAYLQAVKSFRPIEAIDISRPYKEREAAEISN